MRRSVAATGFGVTETPAQSPEVAQSLDVAIVAAIRAGAEAAVLGSAAYARLRRALSQRADVPVFEGLYAGVAYCVAKIAAD